MAQISCESTAMWRKKSSRWRSRRHNKGPHRGG